MEFACQPISMLLDDDLQHRLILVERLGNDQKRRGSEDENDSQMANRLD
jgi:hypothetical protein